MIDKQFAHLDAEQAGHAKRERQAGIIFICFHRIDRLPRHPKTLRQFALAPAQDLPVIFNPIFQSFDILTCKELFTDDVITCQTLFTGKISFAAATRA